MGLPSEHHPKSEAVVCDSRQLLKFIFASTGTSLPNIFFHVLGSEPPVVPGPGQVSPFQTRILFKLSFRRPLDLLGPPLSAVRLVHLPFPNSLFDR